MTRKHGKAEAIICKGVPTFVTPVYLAAVQWNGTPKLQHGTPLFYSCDRCGEVLPTPVAT